MDDLGGRGRDVVRLCMDSSRPSLNGSWETRSSWMLSEALDETSSNVFKEG